MWLAFEKSVAWLLFLLGVSANLLNVNNVVRFAGLVVSGIKTLLVTQFALVLTIAEVFVILNSRVCRRIKGVHAPRDMLLKRIVFFLLRW
jgi:hypothetical protein